MIHPTSVRVVVRMLLICTKRFLRFHFSPSSPCQDFVAATGNLVHPDCVQDVQSDARGDPGHLGTEAQPLKLWRAKCGKNARPVGRHDRDANYEEHHCHGDAV